MKERKSWWILIASVLIAFFIRFFIFEPFAIRSSVMLPNLLENDVVLLNKIRYGLQVPFVGEYLFFHGELKRGDLVIIEDPSQSGEMLIQRLVALEGDEVMYHGGHLYLNSINKSVGEGSFLEGREVYWSKYLPRDLSEYKEQRETLDEKEYKVLTYKYGGRNNFPKQIVPASHVFVLGDNRENSSDSRSFGFIEKQYLRGKIEAIWFSCENSFSKDVFLCDPRSIRWNRIFSKLD